MKLLGKICATTATSALLLTTVPATAPVAHAGVNWGAAAGAIIGTLLGKTAGNSDKSGNSGGGLFGGLSNQKHARQNPTSEEKLFMLAVEENDFGTAQQMLNAGVDINAVYPSIGIYGTTAFGKALENNNRDMMQFLLEHGADVRGWYDYSGNYWSYIERLNIYNNGHADTSLLQYLIDWGTTVNECSVTSQGEKRYPIDSCTLDYGRERSCYTTQFLIDHGAYTENRIGNDGLTPYLLAVYNGQLRLMNILANGGADINARDRNGKTAAQIAIDHKNMQLYKEVQDIMARGQQPSKYQELKANAQKKN